MAKAMKIIEGIEVKSSIMTSAKVAGEEVARLMIAADRHSTGITNLIRQVFDGHKHPLLAASAMYAHTIATASSDPFYSLQLSTAKKEGKKLSPSQLAPVSAVTMAIRRVTRIDRPEGDGPEGFEFGEYYSPVRTKSPDAQSVEVNGTRYTLKRYPVSVNSADSGKQRGAGKKTNNVKTDTAQSSRTGPVTVEDLTHELVLQYVTHLGETVGKKGKVKDGKAFIARLHNAFTHGVTLGESHRKGEATPLKAAV